MWLVSTLLTLSALAVTPAPKELTVNEDDHFYLRADTIVVIPDAFVDERADLLTPITPLLDGRPQVAPASRVDKTPKALYLATVAERGALEKRKLRRYYTDSDTIPVHGFELTVDGQGIVIVGADEDGLGYGLHALASIAKEYGANLPYLRMRDWPTLAFRGVYLRHLPTALELEQLASLRATHLFVESDDFYDLAGVHAETWHRAFEAIRAANMEPIPVFSTLDGMEDILREYPTLIEGRAVEEAIALRGVEPAKLAYPNIIAERAEDISVSVSGVPCVLGEDYWLDGPAIQAPFHPDGPRWRIWRELESRIPNGGTATVSYSIATADSSSLAFSDPRARQWLAERFEHLVNVLAPRHIHLDHGTIGRFNTNTRSLRAGLSNVEYFAQSLSVLTSVVKDSNDDIGLMMWADLLNPAQSASTYGLEEVAGKVPRGIQPLGRVHLESTGEARARLGQLSGIAASPLVVAVDGTPGSIHALVRQMEHNGLAAGGVIALDEDMKAATEVLSAAWSGSGQGGIWLQWLNAYFDANLIAPDDKAIQSALVDYLNKRSLSGQAPGAVYEAYEDFVDRNRDLLVRDEDGAARVKARLALLTEYLSLEEAYSREGDEGTLRKLQRLVGEAQAQDRAPSPERYQRILDTIATQGLFVPASILFQEDLRYFRPGRADATLYEVPALPAYEDTQGKVVAMVELMTGQAPVRRIDFEGLGLSAVSLDISGPDRVFDTVQTWRGSDKQREVRGPVLVKEPVPAWAMRLTATGERTPLVLRDVRVYGEKVSPVMGAHYAVQPPPMVPTFEGRSWASRVQGDSFLQRGGAPLFAEAPTAVRVTHTRDALYFGIELSESRPDAIVADLTARDAPLWAQESVELWFKRAGKAPLRLIVSPLGTQYDSEAYDGGWNGEWTAVAARNERGWSAVVRVPAALLGTFKRGDSLEMNVVRNRMGVRKEESAWAHDYGAQPDLQWGTLRFP